VDQQGLLEVHPLDQQVAELVHELFHKILLHNTRRGNRDPYVWNVACDYVINAGMKKNGFPITGDKAWLYNAQYDGWLAEAVYADLMKKAKEQPKPGQGQGQPGKGSPACRSWPPAART
jgi:predicted metal-dependent peptidase